MQNPDLYLALARSQGPFGWGTCSKYLTQELAKRIKVQTVPYHPMPQHVDGKVLHAVADISFQSTHPISGKYNAGYCFFELDLTQDSVRNACAYDHIFCGSTYNMVRLAQSDVFHTSRLIQGVDGNIFHPMGPRPPDGKFVLFSAGKFEYRKGQDLVLAAFKRLMDKYSDLHLVTAWENLWDNSLATMAFTSRCAVNLWGVTWQEKMASLMEANGIPPDRVTHYPLVSQDMMAQIIRGTDLGVFPNRCEGGTNLAMMEYMACGRPIIASYNSGHRDVLGHGNAILLTDMTMVKRDVQGYFAHWWEPSLDELIAKIELCYRNWEEVSCMGLATGQSMKSYTWEKTADKVIKKLMNPEIDDPLHLPQRYTIGGMFAKLGFTGEGAEVGVYRAGLSRFIYSRWPGKMLHLIDRWRETEGYDDRANRPQEVQDRLYEEVCAMFKDKPGVNIIRDESVHAAKQFQDGQLDWFYLDADHSYDAVGKDLEAWVPKVRNGGIAAGHDYLDGVTPNGTFGVKSAVDEYVAKYGYKLLLSADERNGLRTWYFVK